MAVTPTEAPPIRRAEDPVIVEEAVTSEGSTVWVDSIVRSAP